ALGLAKPAQLVGHGMGQDGPQPARQFLLGLSPKLVQVLMSLQQRLLYQVRGADLALEPRIHLEASQQVEIRAEALQLPPSGLGFVRHTTLYRYRQRSRADGPQRGKLFPRPNGRTRNRRSEASGSAETGMARPGRERAAAPRVFKPRPEPSTPD